MEHKLRIECSDMIMQVALSWREEFHGAYRQGSISMANTFYTGFNQDGCYVIWQLVEDCYFFLREYSHASFARENQLGGKRREVRTFRGFSLDLLIILELTSMDNRFHPCILVTRYGAGSNKIIYKGGSMLSASRPKGHN